MPPNSSSTAALDLVDSVYVLKAAVKSDPRILGHSGVPMAELVSEARALGRRCTTGGVIDLTKLLRETKAALAAELTPCERSVFLDALLSALPDGEAPSVSVCLVHALGRAIRELSVGGLQLLRGYATQSDCEQGPGAIADLDEELSQKPSLKMFRLDGLSIVFEFTSLKDFAALCGRVLERTQLLREHGALQDVVLFIRNAAEARTEHAVLEQERFLSAAGLSSRARATVEDAHHMRNVMVTDWCWPVSNADAAQGALALVKTAFRSALRHDVGVQPTLQPVPVTAR